MPIAYRELLEVSVRSFPFAGLGCLVFYRFKVHICHVTVRDHIKPKACESLESFRKEDPIVSFCYHDRKGVLHHVLGMVEVSQEEVIRNP